MSKQLKATATQVANNLFIYIPLVSLLIYLANKYFFMNFMNGISSLIPTALSIFISTSIVVTVFKKRLPNENKENTFYVKGILSFTISVLINVFLTGLLYIFASHTVLFINNTYTVIISLLTAGIGSAFFTLYNYTETYKKEYRNIVFAILTVITILLATLLNLTLDATLITGLLLSTTGSLALFNYGHIKNLKFDKNILKIGINIPKISDFSENIMLTLPLFLLPYIIILTSGFINAGLFVLALALFSISFIIWHAVKINLFETKTGKFKTNTKLARQGFTIMFISNIAILALSVFLTNSILAIFNIPQDYSVSFITLAICIIPFIITSLFISMFKNLKFFNILTTELLLVTILNVGTFILSMFSQIKIGIDIFILYALFISLVSYKVFIAKK